MVIRITTTYSKVGAFYIACIGDLSLSENMDFASYVQSEKGISQEQHETQSYLQSLDLWEVASLSVNIAKATEKIAINRDKDTRIQHSMRLPLSPPILPMLAKRVDTIPSDADVWIFEPKWDGFRAIIFRDGEDMLLQSRDGKPLDRYFPELRDPLLKLLPRRCVLDGEIVISRDGGLDFDALTLRIHPAASRVKTLAAQSPASIVFFDLLQLDDRDLRDEPFAVRRDELERVLANLHAPLHLTPATRNRAIAQDWFTRFEGAGLDGVIAKPVAGPYAPDKRTMLKIKHERDCDCVVAGLR